MCPWAPLHLRLQSEGAPLLWPWSKPPRLPRAASITPRTSRQQDPSQKRKGTASTREAALRKHGCIPLSGSQDPSLWYKPQWARAIMSQAEKDSRKMLMYSFQGGPYTDEQVIHLRDKKKNDWEIQCWTPPLYPTGFCYTQPRHLLQLTIGFIFNRHPFHISFYRDHKEEQWMCGSWLGIKSGQSPASSLAIPSRATNATSSHQNGGPREYQEMRIWWRKGAFSHLRCH